MWLRYDSHFFLFFFFFNDTATTEIYTLSLHDALPILSNSSDSHYEPTAERTAPIRQGDFVLIDIWGRIDKPGSVFYDITWTGVIGREASEREQRVFETVRNARDAAISTVEAAFAANRPIRGFEADDAAREVV